MHLVFSGGASSPPARSRWSGRGGSASSFWSGVRARSLFSFSFRGRAEWELPARCRLSVPRFRLRCFSLILTACSTTWEFGGDFVVLPHVFSSRVSRSSDRDSWEDKRAGSRKSSSWMSVVVALAPLSVHGHEGGGVGSCGRPLGSLLVFLSRWGRSWSSDRSRSWRGCSRSRCDRSRSWDRDRSRCDRLCRARWWSVDRSRSRHRRTRFFPARWGERRDRERSHARGLASVYLAPDRLRAVVPGQLARREAQEGVEGCLTASCGF